MNRTDLQQLAALRIAEAYALLTLPTPMPDGAYYLAGYAVECALKACIAKQTNQHDFPDKKLATASYTHKIQELVTLSGLEAAQRTDIATNRSFARNWEVVKDWSEEARYLRYSQAKAEELYNAITDGANGVLPWIKARW